MARALGLDARAAALEVDGLRLDPRPVVHTSHPTFGYLTHAAKRTVVWAPEFWSFPDWAAGVDMMFAEAASWSRPIRFAGGVGGHAAVVDVAEDARRHGVTRLVLADVGRPTIRALDTAERPPFGEVGEVGRIDRRLSGAGGSRCPAADSAFSPWTRDTWRIRDDEPTLTS
jgi:hypothetical protein